MPQEQATGVPSMPVTRIEVISHIGDAFRLAPIHRLDLLTAATETGARPEVIELLGRLPDRAFEQVRDLWSYLVDVPIEH